MPSGLYAPFHSSQTVKPCATTQKGNGSQLQRKTTRTILHAFTAQQSTVIQKVVVKDTSFTQLSHTKCGSKLLEASSSGHSNALPVAMKQMPYTALGKLIVVIGLKQVNLNQE